VNLPVALAAPDGWAYPYRFASFREPTLESVWFLACRATGGDGTTCWSPRTVNLLSAALLVAGVAVVWWVKRRREPDVPLWTLSFPALVLALLLGKVYSPQYALWLLPWFALALPSVAAFVVFEVVDLASFVARFGYLRTTLGMEGLDRVWLEVAGAARMAVFVALVVAWVRRPTDAPVRRLEPTPAIGYEA
jgi:hypothetical protein